MAQAFVTRIKTNLNGVLQMTQMVDGIMMTGDDRANQIIVSLHRDRDPYLIPTGTKIVGYFIRSDGITLQIDGSVIADGDDAGKALVVIPALAYQIPGTLSISIRMFNDPSEVSQRGYYEKIETDEFVIVTNPDVQVGPNGEPVIDRTVYENTNKRGYYQLNTDVFIVEEDESVTEGPNGEPIVTIVIQESHMEHGYYKINVGEFIIVDDPDVTQGPHGEPVIIRTITEYANKTVIAAAACFVQMTDTDSVIEPGHLIPDINDVIAMLAKMDEQDHIWMADEDIRIANEHTRLEQEAARVAAESARVQVENARVQAESDRVAVENARVSAENSRVSVEAARVQAELDRVAAEASRVNAEAARVQAENARVQAEASRVSVEAARVQAEEARDLAETERNQGESSREQAEAARVQVESARVTAELARVSAENARVDAEAARVQEESARVSAEDLRVIAETNRSNAEQTRQADQAARNYAIDHLSVSAESIPYDQNPTVAIADVTEAGGTHKHITFGLVPGKPFRIKRTFASVAEMEAYTGTDVEMYEFVIITSTVEDPDNAKLYMKIPTGSGWYFITDLSGAQGIQGPQGIQGIQGPLGPGITSMVLNSDYTMTYTYGDGSTYTTPFSIRGPQGPKGEPGEGGVDIAYDAQSKTLTMEFF